MRARVDAVAERVWSWWSGDQLFDAGVVVCAVAFERRVQPAGHAPTPWTQAVTAALAVPELGGLGTSGTLADRALVTANFRDQYYGLVGAVSDHADGPPLVTSGSIDPAVCHWGQRSVRFAGERYQSPRVQLEVLAPWLRRWADRLLVPKVLVANQARMIEAVADPTGSWLPGVPVLTVRPVDTRDVTEIAAVLTSPVATCWAWHRAAGTGRSATAIRLGPRWLSELPWPAASEPLSAATSAFAHGDVLGCGRAVLAAYGRPDDEELLQWWSGLLPGRRTGLPESTSL